MNWVAIAKVLSQVIPPVVQIIRRLRRDKSMSEDTFLTKLWDRVTASLKGFGRFLPMIAESIKVALDDGDADKVRAVAQELREAAQAQIALADGLDEVVADGEVDGSEGGRVALLLERWVGENADVVKKFGQDD